MDIPEPQSRSPVGQRLEPLFPESVYGAYPLDHTASSLVLM